MTHYKTFMDGLADVEVSGVKRNLNAPPASLASSDLPTLWAQIPADAQEHPPITFQANGGWPVHRGELVVAIRPAGQETLEVNFRDTLEMIDAVNQALATANLCKGPVSWRIQGNVVITLAGTTYWGVVALVEGKG